MIEVLIADNDEALHVELTRLFAGQPITFMHSFTLADAVMKLSQNNFSLLISSMKVGESSGIDLIKICNEYRSSTKTVIIISDPEFDANKEAIVDLNLHSIISKPLQISEIDNLFRDLFSISIERQNLVKSTQSDESGQIDPTDNANVITNIAEELNSESLQVEKHTTLSNLLSLESISTESESLQDLDNDFSEQLLYLDSLVSNLEFAGEDISEEGVSDRLSEKVVIETVRQRKDRLDTIFNNTNLADQSNELDNHENSNEVVKPEIKIPSKKGADDAYISVLVSQDQLQARLVLYPNEENKYHIGDVKQELDRAGVTFGIDHEKISELIDQVNLTQVPVLGEVIAEGIPATPGKDAEVNYEFSIEQPKLVIVEDESGRVDYKDVYQIDSVKEGELLATIIPVQPPVDGTSVLGEVLTGRNGMETRVINGKNCSFDEGTLQFHSEITGQPLLKGNKIIVVPIYVIAGDVDLSIGNVNFMGSVVVNGNVNAGFSITAEEDIRVLGYIEGAKLKAGGEITSKKGFIGGDKGELSAVGRITVKHCTNGTMKCDGDVVIEQYIINSDISCKGKVKCTTGKGCIIGGLTRAVNGVDCLNLGSELGVHTSAIAGSSYLFADMIKKINLYLKLFTERIGKIDKGIDLFTKQLLKNPGLESKLKKLISIKEIISQREKVLIKQKESLLKTLNVKCNAKIKVKNTVYPNVKVQVGNSVLKVQDSLIGCSFSEDPYKNIVRLDSYE